MQHRALEEAAAVGRAHAHLEGLALAIDQQRHLDAGLAERPDAPEQSGEIATSAPATREHNVAGAQVGALRRAAAGQARHATLLADLGGVDAEPRARRTVGAADVSRSSRIGFSRSIGTTMLTSSSVPARRPAGSAASRRREIARGPITAVPPQLGCAGR